MRIHTYIYNEFQFECMCVCVCVCIKTYIIILFMGIERIKMCLVFTIFFKLFFLDK